VVPPAWLEAGQIWVIGVLAASTLLNAGYFLPIVYKAFFKEGNGEKHGEAPWTMVAALVATAVLTVVMFFWADLPLALARSLA
jgi:multicomponent Na+:H+ antiporter subunit D